MIAQVDVVAVVGIGLALLILAGKALMKGSIVLEWKVAVSRAIKVRPARGMVYYSRRGHNVSVDGVWDGKVLVQVMERGMMKRQTIVLEAAWPRYVEENGYRLWKPPDVP